MDLFDIKMTAIADEVRRLTETEGSMSLDDMANGLSGVEVGGIELPELSNPASEEEVFANKQLIDENGEVITGTFTIDSELNTQENLINQIATALEGKAVATGEDVTSETNAYTTKLVTLETAITALETELQGKASGGSGGSGSIKTCTVKIINNVVSLGHVISDIGYSTLDDNGDVSVVAMANMYNTDSEIILNNVICGSYMNLWHYGHEPLWVALSGGLVCFDATYMHFMAPTENGAMGIISLEDDS